MVPIVEQQTAGNVVYLYDALSPRGNEHFAFKAIRFRNPTQKFLEGGTITVFGDDTFVGEGLTEAIAPGASAILPYALDKQVHVEREESFEDAVVGIKGMMTDGAVVEKQRLNTVRFTLHNRSQSDARVYVRHDTDRGWKIKKGPVNLEQLGRMSVFPVELASGEHKTVEIVESAPLTSTLDLTTDAGVDALARYLRANQDDSKFVATAEKLVSAHRSISKKLQRIDHVAGQMVAFRERLDDLHAQVVTLEAVKSKGKLVTSLQERMAEMSARVQKAVIEIVELREQIMLERFAYQDLINELSEMESVPDSSIRHTSSAAFPPRAK